MCSRFCWRMSTAISSASLSSTKCPASRAPVAICNQGTLFHVTGLLRQPNERGRRTSSPENPSYLLESCSCEVSRHKYVMPRTSRNTRWRVFAQRRTTCSQTGHRATTPGPSMYTRASAKRLLAPQFAHCPSAFVISIVNILLNSPAAAFPSR